MKNKCIPSVIISLLLFTLLIWTLIFITWPFNDDQNETSFISLGVTIVVIFFLVVLYFLRNFLISVPKWIEWLYQIFFINVGNFRLNQRYFLISVIVASGILLTLSNIFWTPILFASIISGIFAILEILSFILLANFLFFILYIIALILAIIIYVKGIGDYYNSMRHVCLLIPLFGWVYYFTFQKTFRNEGNLEIKPFK
ncbi:hypothetical protein SALLE_v1c06980 [Spiroplasma alleghenense]|uniref:Transmembrane protein n=1 Tax=Spiroplasma alleghenense TaxID=216931 RepID=A0A345Z439_9MOLU|nr:hypothetical protein SALLE_v1c06980 [Spiroplasma alleghenense]